MGLYEYLNKIEKAKCLEECKFKEKNYKQYPVIKIFPPIKPKIFLISRDPTINFVPIYKYAGNYTSEEKRRILFAAAIPNTLILQIIRFCKKNNLKFEIESLYKLFETAYWTHFHKCPTDENNKFTDKCAKRWLKEEIYEGKAERVATFVCLGKDVKNWVEKNIGLNEIDVISLPHPSGINAEWYIEKKRHKIKENITKLIKLLGTK